MSGQGQRIPTRGPQALQADTIENRQRVGIYVDGNSISYEGTLTTGPDIVCNVHTDLGRRGHYGYIINDGEGDLQVSWSFDGNTYGGIHTLKQNEKISLDQFTVYTIKLTWINTDCDYRIMVM